MIALAACGGLTEWLRSLIGNQVRRNSPVGSSPMSSAKRTLQFQRLQGSFYLFRDFSVTIFDVFKHIIKVICDRLSYIVLVLK